MMLKKYLKEQISVKTCSKKPRRKKWVFHVARGKAYTAILFHTCVFFPTPFDSGYIPEVGGVYFFIYPFFCPGAVTDTTLNCKAHIIIGKYSILSFHI